VYSSCESPGCHHTCTTSRDWQGSQNRTLLFSILLFLPFGFPPTRTHSLTPLLIFSTAACSSWLHSFAGHPQLCSPRSLVYDTLSPPSKSRIFPLERPCFLYPGHIFLCPKIIPQFCPTQPQYTFAPGQLLDGLLILCCSAIPIFGHHKFLRSDIKFLTFL
jgi:hypothetical protein